MAKFNKLFLPVIVLLCFALMLPGCASKYGEQKTKVHYYPQCYSPIKQLREDENLVAKSTATGAVTGALAGAIIGALATGKVEGAVAGAAAGGVVGAAGGYAYGKHQQQKRDAEFFKKYANALDEDIESIGRTMGAAKVARQCYNEQFKKLIADYKSGRITARERDNRYKEIRSGLQEVSFILQQKYDDMSAKDAEYAKALADDYTKAPATKKTYKKENTQDLKARSSTFKKSRNELSEASKAIEADQVAHDNIMATLDVSGANNAA